MRDARRWAWVVMLLAGLAAQAAPEDGVGAPEPALPSPLTLPECLRLFRARGFDLLLAEAAVESARGDLLSAGAVPNPGLSGGYGRSYACDNGRCGLVPTPSWTAGLADNNAIEDSLSGKRGLRQDVAGAALRAARLTRADAERNLVAQVAAAFIQTLLSQESVRYAGEQADEANQLLKLTQLRYRAGAISEADLARVETNKLEADQTVDMARQALRAAQVGLTFLLGFRRTAPEFQVGGDDYLHYRPLPALEAAPESTLIERALGSRPDLKAQAAQAERAQASVRLAKRLRFPDIGLSLGYAQQLNEGPSVNSITPPTFTVGLSTTLPLFYQQQGEVTKAEADLAAQSVQVEKAKAQVVTDVAGAYAGYLSSRRLAQRMEGGLLRRSKVARDLVALQYQKGAASLLELLDAQRTYRGVVLEYVQDVTNYWTSVFRLQQAVGVELK